MKFYTPHPRNQFSWILKWILLLPTFKSNSNRPNFRSDASTLVTDENCTLYEILKFNWFRHWNCNAFQEKLSLLRFSETLIKEWKTVINQLENRYFRTAKRSILSFTVMVFSYYFIQKIYPQFHLKLCYMIEVRPYVKSGLN